MSITVWKAGDHPAFKRALYSVLFAAVCTYLLLRLSLPAKIDILENHFDSNGFNTYHDFDNDGYSETLEFRNRGPNDQFIYVRNHDGKLIDQTNYREPVSPDFMMFRDITGDGYDEIFAVTQRKDSLFLYVHDIVQKKIVYNRLLLLKNHEFPVKESRGMTIFLAGIAAPGVYQNHVIIFALRTNSIPSYLPRSVYAYDLDQKKIITEFRTHSAFTSLRNFDLNGDGRDEIILCGSAYGNIHYEAPYRDDRCWLFVIDQRLNPLFPPIGILEYPACIGCVPIEAGSEKFLLMMGTYSGEKNISSLMYLIDAQGKIRLHKQNPFLDFDARPPVVDYSTNPSEIYGWNRDGSLIKLDHRLQIVSKNETGYNGIKTVFIKDLDADGQKEILCLAGNLLLVFNTELQLAARFPDFDMYGLENDYIFKHTGPGNPVTVGFRWNNHFYELMYSRNRINPFLPFIFIGLVICGFLISTTLGFISAKINVFRQFFNLCFNNPVEGYLIINHSGTILYCNNFIVSLLDLPHQPTNSDTIEGILGLYPNLLEKIKSLITKNRTLQEIVAFNKQDDRSSLNLIVEPLSHLFLKGFGYLIKLSEVRPEKTPQRMHNWSRAVQKMAHDIKTPLSVALNLKALQMRLSKLQLPETERTDLTDDIRMMQTELENIQIMTRNFLKFSNLDRPHFQAFNITDIFQTAVEKYKPYLNENLNIQINPDKDLKPVWADPQQIEMVFHILLENALAAIQGKGLISISVNLAQFLDTSFTEFLEIEVADTGPGIKKEDMARIFEPYFSTKSSGTGMGLAIAKKIIEDHGCTIEVYSKAGFGAVFRFTLPVLLESEQHG